MLAFKLLSNTVTRHVMVDLRITNSAEASLASAMWLRHLIIAYPRTFSACFKLLSNNVTRHAPVDLRLTSSVVASRACAMWLRHLILAYQWLPDSNLQCL